MLQIYNNLTKQKEPFKPIKAKQVGIYVCGLTPYDYCHVGNARISVVFDVVVRYLRARGFKVKHVRNITDIDDKIIKRANENKEYYQKLTERFINFMHEDEAALGVLPPDIEPRATEHMPQIIAMVQTLLDKGYAYLATNGDVYYDINKFKNYGKLAHQDLDNLRAGARVEVTDVKHDPLDFVLWKMSKPNEPAWDSPWGKGRPGWHIECSAMSTHYLGRNFDIHGGGADLVFPHHQNEIAQSEAAFDCKFVNIWMHVGYVQINQRKMAKSLGNFFTLREVLKLYHPETIRYFMLASHYRSPLNYSEQNLNHAQTALTRFYIALRDLPMDSRIRGNDDQPANSTFAKRFYATMNDDFNTPEALAVLFDMVREINNLRNANKLDKAAELTATLKHLGSLLGLLQQDPEAFLHANLDKNKIEKLITSRNNARTNKDWAKADQIRDQLISMGVELEDTPKGTTWHLKNIF
jgi:cysteinyl-tRNA synthetase